MSNTDYNSSYKMSRVKHKNTPIEMLLRSKLHRSGFRFRTNDSKLPGSPDIVLPKHAVAIFVHGCFWHGHEDCSKGRRPATRKEFWLPKIENNKVRDIRKINELLKMGWRVAVVWQCSLDNTYKLDNTLSKVTEWIIQKNSKLKIVEF